MKKWYFIYVLNKNNADFYIGFTDNLNRRLIEHMKTFGEDIQMDKIDECYGIRSEAEKKETEWIIKYKNKGVNLQNKGGIKNVNGKIITTICLNCDNEITQYEGKRKKVFCGSTCRSNYWQKAEKLEKEGLSPEDIIKKIKKTKKRTSTKITNLNNQSQKVGNITEEKPKTNYTVNTKKTQEEMPKGLSKSEMLRWFREH